MHTLILFLTLTLSTQALACPAYKLVTAGDEAPCKGVFLNQAINDKVKRDLTDNDIRKKQIELKDLQINQLSTDREAWKVEAEKQAEVSRSKDGDLKKGVIAGVLLMVVAIIVAGQVKK